LAGYLFDTTGNYQAAFKLMAVCSVVSVILMASLLPGGESTIRSAKLIVPFLCKGAVL